MRKHHLKKYQYDISPQITNQYERTEEKHKANTCKSYKYAYGDLNDLTPIQKRYENTFELENDRDNYNQSVHDKQLGFNRNRERNDVREKDNLALMFRRSGEKTYKLKDDIRKYQLESKSNRQQKNQFPEKEHSINDVNVNQKKKDRMFKKTQNNFDLQEQSYLQQQQSSFLQQNSNILNFQYQQKENKSKHYQRIQSESSSIVINQKQIVDKVYRINRLNQQINNRIKCMLNKMQTS